MPASSQVRARQSVDQPGLAAGQLEGHFDGFPAIELVAGPAAKVGEPTGGPICRYPATLRRDGIQTWWQTPPAAPSYGVPARRASTVDPVTALKSE